MSARKLVSVLLLVAACNDDGGASRLPDAAQIPPDVGTDAAVLPPGCDYAELSDTTNDDVTTMGTAEATGLTFSASSVICGKLDSTHFQPGMMPGDPGLVDIDSFNVVLGAQATLLVTLGAAGAEALVDVEVIAWDSMGNVAGAGVFGADHAVFSVALTPGTYTFSAFAINGAAITAPIDYKIKIVSDNRDTRCPAVAAAADKTEAGDGAQSTGNDMVDVRYVMNGSMNRVLTANADTPEVTNITTAVGTKYRLSGTHADVNAADEYRDRDTFLIRTGADTTRLTIRVDWMGMTSDHDFMLFLENMPAEVAAGTEVGDAGPEFSTFAVIPNTNYWVWTATYDTLANGTTAPTLPSTYDVSICPESFTP